MTSKVGPVVPGWTIRELPVPKLLVGCYVSLAPLNVDLHGDDLVAAFGGGAEDWVYLPYGPFESGEHFKEKLRTFEDAKDRVYWAIVDDLTNKAVGVIGLLRADAEAGSVEVGPVLFSDRLKRTRQGTEAQFLLGCYVFEELNYRRYQWRCDIFHVASKKAAERLGFRFEGVQRNAHVWKGISRDMWYGSLIPEEWFTVVKPALESWLNSSSFDEEMVANEHVCRYCTRITNVNSPTESVASAVEKGRCCKRHSNRLVVKDKDHLVPMEPSMPVARINHRSEAPMMTSHQTCNKVAKTS